MMANISAAAKLEKRYTNHCVRTTALEQFSSSKKSNRNKSGFSQDLLKIERPRSSLNGSLGGAVQNVQQQQHQAPIQQQTQPTQHQHYHQHHHQATPVQVTPAQSAAQALALTPQPILNQLQVNPNGYISATSSATSPNNLSLGLIAGAKNLHNMAPVGVDFSDGLSSAAKMGFSMKFEDELREHLLGDILKRMFQKKFRKKFLSILLLLKISPPHPPTYPTPPIPSNQSTMTYTNLT